MLLPLRTHYKYIFHGNLSKGRVGFGSNKYYSIRDSLRCSYCSTTCESSTGHFLSGILISHPHLLPAAVEQQLEHLHPELEEEEMKETSASDS